MDNITIKDHLDVASRLCVTYDTVGDLAGFLGFPEMQKQILFDLTRSLYRAANDSRSRLKSLGFEIDDETALEIT